LSAAEDRRVRVAVLTVSTSASQGRREDRSGSALAQALAATGAEVVSRAVVADDQAAIEAVLRRWVDEGVAVILTTGGTGLTPDDVTPEATRAVIEREAPGFAEALRAEALRHTPMGLLSRGVAGLAGRSLIVNFPGNPQAIEETFGVLAGTLGHVAATLAGRGDHDSGPRDGAHGDGVP